jgi:hypothetical protein
MTEYTGTGERAAPPYAVTAAALLADCRAALGDTGDPPTWDDAELLIFLNEAIREYSQHLPRLAETRLAAVAGARRYALPADTRALLSVEYPEGRDPAAYLTRLAHKSRRFAQSGLLFAYDFLPRHDLTAAPSLLLSFEPTAGETLVARHTQPHAAVGGVNDYLTVPADHHHVLLGYVLFAAARQLQAAEQAAPTGGSLLMAQLAANARRHELAYLQALNRILTQRQGESSVVAWG